MFLKRDGKSGGSSGDGTNLLRTLFQRVGLGTLLGGPIQDHEILEAHDYLGVVRAEGYSKIASDCFKSGLTVAYWPWSR